MRLEKFNYSSGKRGRWFLYGVICTVALMVLINLFLSQAKYLNTESVKIAEGSISYKPYDFKIIAMYQENENGEYEEIDIMPTSDYVINEEKSYCTIDNINKDNNAVLETMNGNRIVSNLKKNEKCYVWFDKVSTIQNIIETHNLTIRSDFSTTLTTDTTGTLFMAPDDYGTSYYYAGAVQDNWVKFAGFYWRIIRINGDGTLRMIYSGTEESGPATTGEATTIGTSLFNENYNDNAYVGYMYTLGETHGAETSSTIKEVLDDWFINNLNSDKNYIEVGSGGVFCNDRRPSSNNYSINYIGGTGTTVTYYAGVAKLIAGWYGPAKQPSFKCINDNDKFNVNIGLITADEVSSAGGLYPTENLSYYLNIELNYFTMSPFSYGNNAANEFFVGDNGRLSVVTIHSNLYIRPVINLKANTQFSRGDGTINNPYVVS